jgi:hypothetical protein
MALFVAGVLLFIAGVWLVVGDGTGSLVGPGYLVAVAGVLVLVDILYL